MSSTCFMFIAGIYADENTQAVCSSTTATIQFTIEISSYSTAGQYLHGIGTKIDLLLYQRFLELDIHESAYVHRLFIDRQSLLKRFYLDRTILNRRTKLSRNIDKKDTTMSTRCMRSSSSLSSTLFLLLLFYMINLYVFFSSV
jgi:hypothetical protein